MDGRGRAGRGQEGQRQTQTQGQRTRDGQGTDRKGGRARGTCWREGSLGTPRTPVTNAAAKGLIPPGEGRSPHSAFYSQDRLPCAPQRSRARWGRAEPISECGRGACWVATLGGGQQSAWTCQVEGHPTQGHLHGGTPRHSSLTFWYQN